MRRPLLFARGDSDPEVASGDELIAGPGLALRCEGGKRRSLLRVEDQPPV
jgi:hypothetical protein